MTGCKTKDHYCLIPGVLICLISLSLVSCSQSTEKPPDDVTPFLGRWSLFLPRGAGWLEVRQEENRLDGEILWYGGSVVPVTSIHLKNDTLMVTRRRNMPAPSRSVLLRFVCTVTNGELTGNAFMPNRSGQSGNIVVFTGRRIPDLPHAPDLSKISYGDPITLFNGRNLNGWMLTDTTRTNGFKVENGVLVNNPVQETGTPSIRYGNLRTIDNFEDFNLSVEVNVPQGGNSGVYLRGIYEVQILDSYQQPLDSHSMGAVYSRITPSVAAERPADEWQHLDMTLCDRHITVVLNGTTIIYNHPLLGVTGGALTADEFSPGPIYLQGDHSNILYRNMILRPILVAEDE